MPKLKHKELNIKTRIVTSETGDKTYSYTKELQEEKGEHGIFVMLYPTRDESNFQVEDSTSMHIQSHMRELGLSSYTVVNLFASVTKSRLSTRGLVVDEENLIYIKEQILSKISGDDTKVIIAWGNSHLTSQAVNQSKKRLLELWTGLQTGRELYQLTTAGLEKGCTGVHPLYMGIRYNNAVWELEPYPLQKELAKLSNVLEEKKQQGKQEKKSKQSKIKAAK